MCQSMVKAAGGFAYNAIRIPRDGIGCGESEKGKHIEEHYVLKSGNFLEKQRLFLGADVRSFDASIIKCSFTGSMINHRSGLIGRPELKLNVGGHAEWAEGTRWAPVVGTNQAMSRTALPRITAPVGFISQLRR